MLVQVTGTHSLQNLGKQLVQALLNLIFLNYWEIVTLNVLGSCLNRLFNDKLLLSFRLPHGNHVNQLDFSSLLLLVYVLFKLMISRAASGWNKQNIYPSIFVFPM